MLFVLVLWTHCTYIDIVDIVNPLSYSANNIRSIMIYLIPMKTHGILLRIHHEFLILIGVEGVTHLLGGGPLAQAKNLLGDAPPRPLRYAYITRLWLPISTLVHTR